MFLTLQNLSCQDMKQKNLPEFQVEISHPENKYLITPVEDSILTLENTGASLPYGSSSGSWGQSGKIFTERTGTPVGADIIYFSRYENVFLPFKSKVSGRYNERYGAAGVSCE